MTLSKEVKDIIEGVYVFLSTSLKCEDLSDSTDIIRRKLLVQINKYAQTNQSFRIDLKSDENNKYFPDLSNDCLQINLNNGLYRFSTSSGSTSYSNGFSGDDVTSSPQAIVEDTSSAEDNEDFYEEFVENNEFSSLQNSSNSEMGNYKSSKFSNETKSIEDNYSIVKNVPFRNLIARCDHHGLICKRSKTFLKNSRYLGVIADCLLYLYNKENDDKPKIVIDLTEYTARFNSSEDNKRKKEFSFQLLSPGKKTHTFLLLTSRDRQDWLNSLNRAVITKKNSISKYNNHLVDNNSPTYANDVIDGELYEEVSGPGIQYQTFSTPCENQLDCKIDEKDNQHKYYEVPLEENDIDTKIVCLSELPNTPSKKLSKPERPPLPDILKLKIDQSRPLPPEPAINSEENSYDPSIYWEIDNDSSFEKDHDNSMFSDTLHSRSLSQEIFDTINEKVPILPEECQPVCNQRNEEFTDDVDYEIPCEFNHVITEPNTCNMYDPNNSVYQIPTNSWKICDIYEIPPTPVPVLSIKSEIEMSSFEEQSNNVDSETVELRTPLNNNNQLEDIIFREYNSEVNNHCEKREDVPLPITSVKERIKLINEQESILQSSTKIIYKSVSKEKIKNEKSCIQYQSNCNSPVTTENENTNSIENDINSFIMPEYISSTMIDEKTGTFVAKFAYVGEKHNELSFSRGDKIVVVDISHNTWWEAELRGKKGFVHKNYLRLSD